MTLEQHYSKDNAALRFLVYDEFFSISKAEDESLTSLVGRVEDTLQKLRSSRSDTLSIADFESQLAAMVLIRSLPEEFASFKSSLLLLDSASVSENDPWSVSRRGSRLCHTYPVTAVAPVVGVCQTHTSCMELWQVRRYVHHSWFHN